MRGARRAECRHAWVRTGERVTCLATSHAPAVAGPMMPVRSEVLWCPTCDAEVPVPVGTVDGLPVIGGEPTEEEDRGAASGPAVRA